MRIYTAVINAKAVSQGNQVCRKLKVFYNYILVVFFFLSNIGIVEFKKSGVICFII
jgi:hypothetical protein